MIYSKFLFILFRFMLSPWYRIFVMLSFNFISVETPFHLLQDNNFYYFLHFWDYISYRETLRKQKTSKSQSPLPNQMSLLILDCESLGSALITHMHNFIFLSYSPCSRESCAYFSGEYQVRNWSFLSKASMICLEHGASPTVKLKDQSIQQLSGCSLIKEPVRTRLSDPWWP